MSVKSPFSVSILFPPSPFSCSTQTHSTLPVHKEHTVYTRLARDSISCVNLQTSSSLAKYNLEVNFLGFLHLEPSMKILNPYQILQSTRLKQEGTSHLHTHRCTFSHAHRNQSTPDSTHSSCCKTPKDTQPRIDKRVNE